MKFLNITGPRADIDRVSEVYLSKYEIQLEPALSGLKTTQNLTPFMENNPYKSPLERVKVFSSLLEEKEVEPDLSMSKEEILTFVKDTDKKYHEIQEQISTLQEEKKALWDKFQLLEPFCSLNFDLNKVMNYKHMQVRFGRISIADFHKLDKYLYHDINAIFLESTRDNSYVYGCYFVTNKERDKVASVFSSFHFERINMPADCNGTADSICQQLMRDVNNCNLKIKDLKDTLSAGLRKNASRILGANQRLEEYSSNFDVRKMAACMKNDDEDYYILCGWMSNEDVENFRKDVADDDNIFLVVEDDEDKHFGEPPTKLKNPKFFKPFELFVEMYGLPSSNEIDPTIFLALTYTFIFGAMFGDVGQGLCLFLIGGLIYLKKKSSLAGIISSAGIFSTFFGFMFGSIFGFEDILPALWLRPMKAMVELPFIGRLNTVFVIAVAFGMILNLVVMVFQMICAHKRGDLKEMFLSHNGAAGIVFYGFLVLTIFLYMTGHRAPGNVLLVIFLGLPILIFMFKDPLDALLKKKKPSFEGGAGMFIVQQIFELFETMLSYFSNTLSYVRIGAFAVSHAAIMEVVLMLSGASAGHINILGVIVGNAIVCALEGLIVGIQVLRLEYYELFSRFYKGGGRAFKPFHTQKKIAN